MAPQIVQTLPHFGFSVRNVKMRVRNRSATARTRGQALALDMTQLVADNGKPGNEDSIFVNGVDLLVTADGHGVVVVCDEDIAVGMSGLAYLSGARVFIDFSTLPSLGDKIFSGSDVDELGRSGTPVAGKKIFGWVTDNVSGNTALSFFDGLTGFGQT